MTSWIFPSGVRLLIELIAGQSETYFPYAGETVAVDVVDVEPVAIDVVAVKLDPSSLHH